MTLRGRPPSPWEPPRPPGRSRLRLLILIGALLLFVLALMSAFPPDTWREGQGANLLYFALFAAVVILGIAGSRQSLARIGAQFTAWALILAAVVAAYGYRHELDAVAQRALGELMPSRGMPGGADIMTYRRASDGQFWIDAVADGRKVHFLVDTGASSIVLSRQDATRLGIAIDRLSYTRVFDTANGKTRGAAIELDELSLGSITFTHVPAWVTEGELSQSLLGMGLLNRLGSVEMKGDTLTIRR